MAASASLSASRTGSWLGVDFSSSLTLRGKNVALLGVVAKKVPLSYYDVAGTIIVSEILTS